jgi:NhaA family Na+:H+ antiporter
MRAFQQFTRSGALSGLLLLVSAAAAIVWANSPWSATYFSLFDQRFVIGAAGGLQLDLSLHAWLNDGLMATFFLLVGLEIKRELIVGELASIRRAGLPIAAAIGGMVVPAALYALLAPGGEAARGWGIPMATDIAFVLGILALLGDRVPYGLKVFLTALAIVDDMGAVVIIALFYSGPPHAAPLGVAAAAVVGLIALNRGGVRPITPYLLIGCVLWLAVHETGIHPTIAGVLLALTIPSRTRIHAGEFSTQARTLLEEFEQSETGDLLVITSKGQQEALHALERVTEQVQAPLLRLEHALQPLVQYWIMPLFAFANAGVRFADPAGAPLLNPVTGAIVAGLVIGKPLGVFGFSWLAVRFRLADLPSGVTWRSMHGAAWLAGIGFTMSLFIATLAFGSDLLSSSKTGILVGSVTAGLVGSRLLHRAARGGRDAASPRSP